MRDLGVIGFAFGLVMVFGGGAALATDVGGAIGTDTTWSLAGSPYVLTSDVELAFGATLTVAPGVVVAGQSHALRVSGAFVAAGTAGMPVSLNHLDLLGEGLSEADSYFVLLDHVAMAFGVLRMDQSGRGTWTIRDSVIDRIDELRLVYPLGVSQIERNDFANVGRIDLFTQGGSGDIELRDNRFSP